MQVVKGPLNLQNGFARLCKKMNLLGIGNKSPHGRNRLFSVLREIHRTIT